MSFRPLAVQQIFWLQITWLAIVLYLHISTGQTREFSCEAHGAENQFISLGHPPWLSPSHITMPITGAPSHSSTHCQHFTDPNGEGSNKGGGAGMLAGGREKEEGEGGGTSKRGRCGAGVGMGGLRNESMCSDATQRQRIGRVGDRGKLDASL